MPNGSQRLAGKDCRGSCYDRRARRAFLVSRFGVPRLLDGALTRIACYWCARLMRAAASSWEVDRYPICGHAGGRYTRANIVPACRRCNGGRCRAGGARCRRRLRFKGPPR